MQKTKLFILQMVCLLLALNAGELHAQNEVTVSANHDNVTVLEVLDGIQKATSYAFFYNNADVDVSKIVSVHLDNVPVSKVISTILPGYRCRYDNKKIIIVKNDEVVSVQTSHVGPTTITGKITDSENVPLIGASAIVTMAGKPYGAITDLDGKFSLELPVAPTNESIVLSFIGFKDIQMPVGGQKHFEISMTEDFLMLDKVVVVGYGTQRRSDVTGAIASVTSETLNTTPTTSVGEMLRGAAAGVHVSLGSAEPGGSSSVLIRGRRSLSGDNAPLYIVDGVPMTSIDDINSNDIESMEILKDASSQSIYGARAANGVILITTKRGQEGKLKVSYSGYVAVQDINRNFEFYNGEEWAAYRAEAYYNAYGSFDEEDCLKGLMLDSYVSGEWVDWEDLMINPAIQHKHDIYVQSGNDKTKYAFGIGAYLQDGMVLNSGFDKISGRLNIDHKISKSISLGANMSFARSWKQSADGSFNTFVTMPPLAKVYQDDGITLRKDVTEAGESHYNPLWNINNSDSRSKTDRLLINLFGDWKIAKGLT